MHRVDIIRTLPLGSLSNRFLAGVARRVLRGERVREAEISLVFVSDRRIRRINAEFLRHDYATDVIAFPLEDPPVREAEIYISAETARRNARRFHAPFREEIARLVIHGILHLCGFEDDPGEAAERMRRGEERYLQALFHAR